MSEGNRLFHWQVYVCDVMAVTSEPINSVNCTLTLRLTDHIYSGNLLIALPRTFRTSKDARCDSGEDFLSFCNSKPSYECNNIIISKMNDKKKSLCENITALWMIPHHIFLYVVFIFYTFFSSITFFSYITFSVPKNILCLSIQRTTADFSGGGRTSLVKTDGY